MNRESFLETICKQYADEIHEAYLECEHEDGKSLDLGKLHQAIKTLRAHAAVEGLSAHEFDDLARSTLPEKTWDQLQQLHKRAA